MDESRVYAHKPVLRNEVIEQLAPQPGAMVIDGTLGGGGHAHDLIERIAPDGTYIGIDLDTAAIENAHQTLTEFAAQQQVAIHFAHENFSHIAQVAHDFHYTQVDSILADLGFSSYHVDQSKRGFSFSKDEPLDMRFDPESDGITAEKIINTFPEAELARILWEYGEEKFSRRIAAEIVKQRKETHIKTTAELLEVIRRAAPQKHTKQKQKPIHPSTRSFQALRIAVNDELGNLRTLLKESLPLLKPGGRIAIISFHSLEDRIVKQFFQQESRDCICPPEIPVCVCEHKAQLRIVTKKPIMALPQEIFINRRARSAKLRVAEKLS